MSVLTFNAVTSNKKLLGELKDVPFQIMPGGRSSLTSEVIKEFKEMNNPQILIHYKSEFEKLYHSCKETWNKKYINSYA